MTDITRQFVTKSSLSAFVFRLFNHKILAVIMLSVTLTVAALWLRSRTPLYEINMVLSPTETLGGGSNQNTGAISSILKSSNKGNDTETGRLLYMITSERLVRHLKSDLDLVQMLYGPPGPRREENWMVESIREITGQPEPKNASAGDAALWLRQHIRIREVQETDLTELKMLHEDPQKGNQLLLALYNGADSILRQEALVLSQDRAQYLKDLLSEVVVSEYRETLLGLLMEQEKRVMLLQDGSAYAAKILEGPQASSAPVYPNYNLTLILAPLIAVVATVIIIVLIGWLREVRNVTEIK